jgi:threonylcarbamoyladenosine tRNA methylthiotransferase MtaB
MPTVTFKTFGCKLNQAETASLVQSFENHGYTVISDETEADVVVLNTCTVTHRSDAKCGQSIRHVLQNHPGATVVVVGCYSQIASRTIAQIPGVDYILGTQEKFSIFDYFTRPGKLKEPVIKVNPVTNIREAKSDPCNYQQKTRAFLKIQDGCGRFCSYCIVPYARGPSRSVPDEEVIRRTVEMIRQDYQEIVLTGVHIGEFGREHGRGSRLPHLLRRLIELDNPGRIRLSSLNPEDITEDLLDCIEGTDKICRHFHIPLQSGSTTILTAMNRKYSSEDVREKIESIIHRFGDVGLGADVIAGFPGETDSMFEETFRFIQSLPFTYLHVFPYSVRRGTQAAEMDNPVPAAVRMGRAKKLRALGEEKKRAFVEKWIGREAKVLLENRNRDGLLSGLSAEYIRVEVPYQSHLRNRIASVDIQEVVDLTVRGRVQDDPED